MIRPNLLYYSYLFNIIHKLLLIYLIFICIAKFSNKVVGMERRRGLPVWGVWGLLIAANLQFTSGILHSRALKKL